MFNPVGFDAESFRVLREPLALSLQIIILGAMGHVYWHMRSGKINYIHLFILSLSTSFLMLVREEDIILYGVIFIYGIISFYLIWRIKNFKIALKTVGIALEIILSFILVGNFSARIFIYKYYGAPIIHDFGEGEFPKFIAALRSIDSSKDNRLVMPTQESLLILRDKIPISAELVSMLPRPGAYTDSCNRFGVCSEWTSGFMYFWIKDAAFAAGKTPDLVSSQLFFRELRIEIEKACKEGRIKCTFRGNGMFPPFELRWTRALVYEFFKAIELMWQPPFSDPKYPQDAPVDPETSKLYKFVTMSSYDAPLPSSVNESLSLNELKTYYTSPLHSLKYRIQYFFSLFGSYLLCFGFISFLYLLWHVSNEDNLQLIVFIVIIATSYSALRLAALSYLSISIGTLDPRLYFSTYVVALITSVPLIYFAIDHYFDGKLFFLNK